MAIRARVGNAIESVTKRGSAKLHSITLVPFSIFFYNNHNTSIFPIYFFPPEGNFDIDARDGGGTIYDPKYRTQIVRTEIVYTSVHFPKNNVRTHL